MTRRGKRRGATKGPPQQVRIIAGRWRGRKLKVPGAAGLRPTPDRVRETLFNWLAPHLDGARCLDLFAGSGALGFEALSRGAAAAVLVESNAQLAATLREEAQALEAENAVIVCTDAIAWLAAQSTPFDIVFLDPPFADDLAARACALLVERDLLTDGALVYVETAPETGIEQTGLEKVKQGRAGQVQYRLLKFTRHSQHDQDGDLSRHL